MDGWWRRQGLSALRTAGSCSDRFAICIYERARPGIGAGARVSLCFAAACWPAKQRSGHWKFYNVQYCFHLTFIIHWTPINVSCQCISVRVCVLVCVCGFHSSLRECDSLSISFHFLQLRANDCIYSATPRHAGQLQPLFTAWPSNLRLAAPFLPRQTSAHWVRLIPAAAGNKRIWEKTKKKGHLSLCGVCADQGVAAEEGVMICGAPLRGMRTRMVHMSRWD